jgi:hypothetical protein
VSNIILVYNSGQNDYLLSRTKKTLLNEKRIQIMFINTHKICEIRIRVIKKGIVQVIKELGLEEKKP